MSIDNTPISATKLFPCAVERARIKKVIDDWMGTIVSIKEMPDEEYWMADPDKSLWHTHVVVDKGVLYIDGKKQEE